MNKLVIPAGYTTPLSERDMQKAIECVKRNFQDSLCRALNLRRVTAPLFVSEASGLNDNLSGVERPVDFDIPSISQRAQIVHSLAKWKRYALMRYEFLPDTGLYTDMNAIRRDEATLDNLHSVYVDQWDWEKVITRENRTVDMLKETVRAIVGAICDTSEILCRTFPVLKTKLEREVTFVTTQELEDRYPDLTPSQRENAITKEYKTVFLMQIGGALRSGKPHDSRAPDYDDWSLNGDIFFYDDVLDRAIEISSMGIRVDEKSLDAQLHISGCDDRRAYPFHKMLLEGKLPLSIGGGIGQSRLCMLLIGTCHVGEVQVSLWDEDTIEKCRRAGVRIL